MSQSSKILRIIDEAVGVKTFILEKPDEFDFLPGQYCWLALPGYNPAPMAIASGNTETTIRFSIRAWGKLTNALFLLREGDQILIDGPHGSGFPMDMVNEGQKVYLIAGGTGITPVRSVVKSLSKGDLEVFYGSKTPEELLYSEEIQEWEVNVNLTVDFSTNGWTGNVGLVTSLLNPATLDSTGIFFVCGPIPMEAAIVKFLQQNEVEDSNIYVSLEKFDKEGNVVGPVLPVTHHQVDFDE